MKGYVLVTPPTGCSSLPDPRDRCKGSPSLGTASSNRQAASMSQARLMLLLWLTAMATRGAALDCISPKELFPIPYYYMEEVFAANMQSACESRLKCEVSLRKDTDLRFGRLKTYAGCDVSDWIIRVSVDSTQTEAYFGGSVDDLHAIHLSGLKGKHITVIVTEGQSCSQWDVNDAVQLFMWKDSILNVALQDNNATCSGHSKCGDIIDDDFDSEVDMEAQNVGPVYIYFSDEYTMIYFRVRLSITKSANFELSLWSEEDVRIGPRNFEMIYTGNTKSFTWIYMDLARFTVNRLMFEFSSSDPSDIEVFELEMYADLSGRVNALREDQVTCRAGSHQQQCERAYDGEIQPSSREWVSQKTQPAWISFELSHYYTISTIRIMQRFCGCHSIKDLTITFGNEGCFEVTLPQSKGQNLNDETGRVWHTWDVPNIHTNIITLTVNSFYAEGVVGFMEVELLGYEAADDCDEMTTCQNGGVCIFGQCDCEYTYTGTLCESVLTTGDDCVRDCDDLDDGSYQNCRRCTIFVNCTGGVLEEDFCENDQEWHEADKMCKDGSSGTCQLETVDPDDIASPRDCEAGWLPYGAYCYHFASKGKAYSLKKAKKGCVSLGGELVSIHSQGENDFIKRNMERSKNHWLGLKKARVSPDAGWRWLDGSAWDWSNWKTGFPQINDRCAVIKKKSGLWKSIPCRRGEHHLYICKKVHKLF